ncbi:extracellular solute-binding protein [Radiobacillus sp. PE A8.2]|uniref:extracellular solute-binding protein n=1 Tax=Radiobacillus sp. PE A8.2 TaxID=3380349 RepID=UPI00388DA950
MKRLLIFFALFLLLVGCNIQEDNTNSNTGNTNGNDTSNSENSSNTNDEGSEEEQLEGEISLMMFEGGFGSDWVKRSAAEFEEMHPEVTVNITASPDIHTQLQTRFISGDVPDIMNPGAKVDIQGLVNQGEILALDDYLEEPSFDDESVSWRDSFIPAQFKLQKDGQTYGIPTIFGAGYLWWYNAKVFDDNGWELPQTWDDVEELKEKAAEKDMALFALQGKYPGYYFYGYYLPLVQKIGGTDALLNAFNLEEGAWEAEPFLKAAEITANLREKDFLLDGTLSLSHTDSQTQFFLGNSVFVSAGTWLEGEMQDVIPEDFKLRAMNQPGWEGQSEEENNAAPITSGWGGAFYIPSKAKNPDLAAEFLKYLTAKESIYKMMERGLASTVKGTEDAIQSEALASSLEVIKNADSKTYLPTSINDSYPELANNLLNKLQGVLTGDVTPEEFVQYAEEKATEVREDSSIEKVEFNW